MRIALFLTCINDTLLPDTGRAVVTVLERLGHTVDFPQEQTCCGQMHFNTGYRTDAMPLVRHFADTFSHYDAVITPSASCAGMVRENHPLLTDRYASPDLRRKVAGLVPRVHEFTEFLTDVLGVTDVGARFPHKVAYHPTCHSLRGLRLGDRPERLLRAVDGLELLDLGGREECCGFGGTFAMKNAATSAAMLADKTADVTATAPDVLCAADNSCLLHIGGGLSRQNSPIRTMHLAEILATIEEDPR
ncbi:(Fe-S)-binding protein [Streptomyces sp. BE20]|uniref:(Fe-S)-binding protein n=1 Tax=unclassified Streptomyces TaxID=2593676 RepID=UPI002E798997|nr:MULTISPECIES: (Fe-S)-binding protein [unclassified Streptomyces]MED7948789.1 (Fe-S)-binding protein [Streptomyces sp. BE303]MEE1821278.1 (Fe-S)-binding protein [Streptomyces sp. BE20]